MVCHLKSKHKELHTEYLKKLSDEKLAKDIRPASQSSSKQLTLSDMRKWDISDPQAHFKIAEMIALDYQPFSMMDDVGFSCLLSSLEPHYTMLSRRPGNVNLMEHQIHMMLRDNGANMVKAFNDAVLPHYGCFAHNLQLVINDGIQDEPTRWNSSFCI